MPGGCVDGSTAAGCPPSIGLTTIASSEPGICWGSPLRAWEFNRAGRTVLHYTAGRSGAIDVWMFSSGNVPVSEEEPRACRWMCPGPPPTRR